jgi:hypothetical protein
MVIGCLCFVPEIPQARNGKLRGGFLLHLAMYSHQPIHESGNARMPAQTTLDLTIGPLTITTQPGGVTGDGLYGGVYGGLSVLGGLSLGLGNPAGPLSSFLGNFDLNLSIGQGQQYGIDLGSDIGSTLGLPLANALPYILGVGTGISLQFGNASVDTGGKSLALALDPSDPALLVGVNNFAFGGSLHGYIPFTPLQIPTALAAAIANNNGVAGYGNIYANGSVDLGEIPVTLGGSEVIGLDPNHTGSPLGISGQQIVQLVNGQLSLASVARWLRHHVLLPVAVRDHFRKLVIVPITHWWANEAGFTCKPRLITSRALRLGRSGSHSPPCAWTGQASRVR